MSRCFNSILKDSAVATARREKLSKKNGERKEENV